MAFYGSSIIGSEDLQVSVAGQEILPKSVVNFELLNNQNCHISINNNSYVYLRGNQGVQTTMDDFIVYSVKIQEDGIVFNWIGTANS